MGKMENVMREEIRRLARKEIRQALAATGTQVKRLKQQVSRLTREVQALRKTVPDEQKMPAAGQMELPAVSATEVGRARVSPTLLKKLRKRLDISQEELAQLVGVSTPAVSAWEQGRSRPSGQNLAAILALRKMGRREVQARLPSE